MTTQDRTPQGGTTDNTSIVAAAFAALTETGDVDAVARVLDEDFVHHRPAGTSRTKAEWLAAVRGSLEHIDGMEVTVLHLLAEGDHVMLHSRRRLPSGPEITVVDIMRFETGRIAEAWELIEPTAEAGAHLTWWA
ncbi:nuclear transport factor 2 family protein [Promicromonospora kroppenstedtii]|uniref:nuclear transport factor 2 family protein n=1 Tax=Promicromonospora kroppenstedtii TaxID=440482 RepID=UPI0004B0B16E|nr:nuclear transport factor 2 family protein [Promicromonospora kroppenstedtii]